MRLPDPRQLDEEVRLEIAERARRAHDARAFTDQLLYFNSGPCLKHSAGVGFGTGPREDCRDCGIELRRHQRTGTAWLWFAMRGLLADSCGLGKTAQVAAVLAAALQTGELCQGNRAVIVCQAAAVRQWAAELRRLVPSLSVIAADGGPDDRMQAYLGAWECCVISDRTLTPAGTPGKRGFRAGDVERLRQFPVGIVAYDDIDAMRNRATKTAWAVKRLAAGADRVYGVHASALQKRLPELYCHLEPVGGLEAFGTLSKFKREYVDQHQILIWLSVARALPRERNEWARQKGYASFAALGERARADRDQGLTESDAISLMAAVNSRRARLQRAIMKDSGVRENALPEFRRKIAPMILRRTVRDLDDVRLPAVQENQVWLDLLPQQRQRYDALAKGILTRLRDGSPEVTHVEAAVAYTRARQVCSGLAALDDHGDVSAKLDWVMDRVTGDLSDDKMFCFVYFRENVEALAARLEAAGVGHVLLWSRETNPAERAERMRRFNDDRDCRVVVATTTAERSLNLQAAEHVAAIDTIVNPARMAQILGRARRMGSRHSMVVFHHLLARDTMEEEYPAILRREQAMSDAVWEDTGELFSSGSMSPRQVMEMIARGKAA